MTEAGNTYQLEPNPDEMYKLTHSDFSRVEYDLSWNQLSPRSLRQQYMTCKRAHRFRRS